MFVQGLAKVYRLKRNHASFAIHTIHESQNFYFPAFLLKSQMASTVLLTAVLPFFKQCLYSFGIRCIGCSSVYRRPFENGNSLKFSIMVSIVNFMILCSYALLVSALADTTIPFASSTEPLGTMVTKKTSYG